MTPALTIVRGSATPQELAALTASLTVFATPAQPSGQMPDAVQTGPSLQSGPARPWPGADPSGEPSRSAWRRPTSWNAAGRLSVWPPS
ncbi:MAG: acyl-CoA carboxylase subunit epsilon [Bifidobacteriaceae bacterium]|nr:acyl-CoA carboxylase subunit epsilon [Bifidobacteriaceae bacterium]